MKRISLSEHGGIIYMVSDTTSYKSILWQHGEKILEKNIEGKLKVIVYKLPLCEGICNRWVTLSSVCK